MLHSGVWARDVYALIDIILIDLVLAGDNAIVIGMAASQVSPKIRKNVIAVGISVAVGLRVMLALLATWLLAIPGLILGGGVMLFFVCWKMFQDIRQSTTATNHGVVCFAYASTTKMESLRLVYDPATKITICTR